MDQRIKDSIANIGVPLAFYTSGILRVGPNNSSAVDRVASVGTTISHNNLPLPPSRITEFFADRITGESKQDYRLIVDGEPGSGKSTSFLYLGGRFGCDMSERANWEMEQDDPADWISDVAGTRPKDFFNLNNCALLQDTEGLTYILDNCQKRQAIIVDDAGVTAGNKDSQTQRNKNIGAIMQTCRTKRLLLLWNAPMRKHIDLQVRELVYAKGYILKSCHASGFNIVKINITKQDTQNPNAPEWKHRFTFDGKKLSFYIMWSPDFIDEYKGMNAIYEKNRDQASDDLIHDRHTQEHTRKNPVDKAKETWDKKMGKYFKKVLEYCENAKAENKKIKRTEILTHCPDLTERDAIKMIALYNSGEYKEVKK